MRAGRTDAHPVSLRHFPLVNRVCRRRRRLVPTGASGRARVRARGIAAHVRTGAAMFACDVEEVSVAGAFLRTDHRLEAGEAGGGGPGKPGGPQAPPIPPPPAPVVRLRAGPPPPPRRRVPPPPP